MATLENLFSSPGMLNRTGVNIKLRSPITDAEIANYESGPKTTRNIMSAETLKSLRNAAAGSDTIQLAPGQVGVEKTPEFSRTILQHAASTPLMEWQPGGPAGTPAADPIGIGGWIRQEMPGFRLGDITREPQTEVQRAIKESQMGSAMMTPGVQGLAGNIEATRKSQLDEILKQEGKISSQLTSPEHFRSTLSEVNWSPTDEYGKDLESALGAFVKDPEQKRSGWGDFAKQAASVILAPLGGGIPMLLGMGGMIAGMEKADKQKKTLEADIAKARMGSTSSANTAKQTLDDLFDQALGRQAPLDGSVYRGGYRALGGY